MKLRLSQIATAMLLLAIAVTSADAAKKPKKTKAQGHPPGAAAAGAAAPGNAVIAGSVKNRAGHGVAGATVRLQHLASHRNHAKGAGPHVRTNRAGDFTLRAPVARYAIIASKRDVGSQRAFITPSAGSSTRLTIIIAPHHHHRHHHRHRHHRPVPVRVPTPPRSTGTSTQH
jgi:hypothetical protein